MFHSLASLTAKEISKQLVLAKGTRQTPLSADRKLRLRESDVLTNTLDRLSGAIPFNALNIIIYL